MKRILLLVLLISVAATQGDAQFGPRRARDGTPSRFIVDRGNVPDWELDEQFPEDVFTFVRVMYNPRGRRGGKWRTDYPDAELNFSFRLQQLTALEVNPDPIVLQLTDPELFNYPFLYFVEPGGYGGYPGTGLNFSHEEIIAFRRYLENGGFAMFDDFWGEAEWDEFYREIKRVLPDREPVDLALDHPVFNIVYELDEKPQVPHMQFAVRHRHTGITWERDDAKQVNYRGIFDDDGRMMVMICHNTDLADGWEWEGHSEWFFREFSEKKAYPMGINILLYALTH